jgi:hypothetical protein
MRRKAVNGDAMPETSALAPRSPGRAKRCYLAQSVHMDGRAGPSRWWAAWLAFWQLSAAATAHSQVSNQRCAHTAD